MQNVSAASKGFCVLFIKSELAECNGVFPAKPPGTDPAVLGLVHPFIPCWVGGGGLCCSRTFWWSAVCAPSTGMRLIRTLNGEFFVAAWSLNVLQTTSYSVGKARNCLSQAIIQSYRNVSSREFAQALLTCLHMF